MDTAIAKGPMLPGTMSWYSPRNKIGVHPESLLYNRDPEQLAEDVIGLANRNVDLAEQNVGHSSHCCPCSEVIDSVSNEVHVSNKCKPGELWTGRDYPLLTWQWCWSQLQEGA